MTVADNTSRNQYTATPSQALFAYTFEIVDKDDIVVLINGTPLSEGTDYTVTGVGSDTGGNIVLTSGTTGGNIVTIYRDMPYSRTQNYTNSGDFLASEVNSDFDNLWLAGEQTNRAFSQSIRKPITDSDSISMELPEAADRTDSFLTFDSTGAVSTSPLSSALSPSIIARQQFTGDGSTTAFTLAADPGSAAAVVIYIDGVYQEEGTYSVSGTTVTFTEAPPTNASIEVVSYKTTAVGTTTANAVSITDSGGYYTSNNVEGALQETAQSQNIVYTPAGTGAVQTTVQTKLRESVSVKDFGAVGDGVTDDTAAINAAWAFASATTNGSQSGEVAGELNRPLYFPQGDYIYNGSGLTIVNGNINIIADPSSVRVRLPDGIYFITATGAISNTYVEGINTLGGKGFLHYTFTGNNVSGKHTFVECMFSDYTECAIGNESEDFPNIQVDTCIFRCREGSTAFGLAFGGFADNLYISNCDFRKNKVHIKLGDRLSGNIYVKNNTFINTGSQVKLADIWIVPNTTDAQGNASGQGTLIQGNKFGNEGMAAGDTKILVSTEGSGDRTAAQPSLAWNTSGFVSDIKIQDNSVSGVGSQTAAFITSYVQKCLGWTVHDNDFQGGNHTYLVEFLGGVIDDYLQCSWDIRYSHSSNPAFRYMPVSNKPMGIATDPFLQTGNQMGCVQAFPSMGQETGFVDLLPNKALSGFSAVSSSASTVTDALGGTNAREVTASSATGRIVSGVLTAMPEGSVGFVEVDLKKGSSLSADTVDLFSYNFSTAKYNILRTVKLTDDWKRFIIPFVQPEIGGASNFQLTIRINGYSSGSVTKFQVGLPQVYKADQAMSTGHIRTLGTGLWDGGHIIMGSTHIWVDSTGDLRIKSSAPTSDTDGTIVGTQS